MLNNFIKLNKNKKAFTLAEVMMVVAVIGIISAATIQITNSQASYIKKFQYYSAFKGVQGTAGEIVANGYKDSDGNLQKQLPPNWNDTASSALLKQGLCQRLYALFNTVGPIDCSQSATSNFNNSTPDFITTNGERYFYGGRTGTTYIIYIDANGLKGKGVLNDDVYSFYMGLDGSAIPDPNTPGFTDKTILSASVKMTDASGNVIKLLNGVSFQQAECNAGTAGIVTSYCGGYGKLGSCTGANSTCYAQVNRPGF